MAIEDKFMRDLSGLFNYSTDTNPTTQADYMEAVKNWVHTEEAIVDSHLWQPTTVYNEGNQVRTPSLPAQYVLVCTTAGTSGSGEPDYTNVDVGDSVTDGTVTWLVSEALTSAGCVMGGGVQWNGINDDTFSIGMSDANNDNVDVGWLFDTKKGAGIGLRNISHTDGGVFNLWATNGTNTKTLVGKADGTFNWDGNHVATILVLGNAPNNTNTNFTLPSSGTYLLFTGHNSSPGMCGIWMIRTGGNSAFKLAGGVDVTISCSGTRITVRPTAGQANVWAMLLPPT